MRLATPKNLIADSPPNILAAAEAFALTERRLKELDRLRCIGMEQAETLSAVTRKLSGAPDAQYRALAGGQGTIREFDRLNRAIRQIVVLEFELRGLFKAPDRGGIAKPKLGARREDLLGDLRDYNDLFDDRDDIDDLNDLNDLRVRLDYRKDPVDRLVADIRAMLGADAPADDPFASPRQSVPRPMAPRQSTAEPAPMSREAAVKERAMENLRRALAARQAAKSGAGTAAAPVPAKAAAKLPRKGFRIPPTSPHNPNTPAAKRGRRNRGPPR